MYRTIGRCLCPGTINTGGISRVDIPYSHESATEEIDPKTWTGPWRAITDPEQIGFYICQANIKQYNQAENTPFGSGYIAEVLQDVLTSDTADALLESKLDLDQSKIPLRETQTILEFLGQQYTTPIQYGHINISPDEFKSTYSIVKEKTSSSLSGRHVGHYKAVLDNDSIIMVHAAMMSIPYQTGFSPSRWHQVVDVMLEKDPGQPRQHRLRIVALLESDYNQSQRIVLARRLAHHMEDFQMVPDMQYGSRPGKLCISPVLNKVISYDVIRQTKVSGAFIENDAIGCYDRLVNSIVFLELRHLGFPIQLLKTIQDAWNNAVHHIKTKYGCIASYSNTCAKPLFGPGQGSTTGPNLWGVLFSVIAKTLPQEVPAIFFKAVNDVLEVHSKGDAFVDDTQLGSTSTMSPGFSNPSSNTEVISVLSSLQALAQSWERLLFTTGGALNLQKKFLDSDLMAMERWNSSNVNPGAVAGRSSSYSRI